MPAWPGLEKRDPRVGSGSCSGVDVQPAPHATLASGLVTSRRPSRREEEVCPGALLCSRPAPAWKATADGLLNEMPRPDERPWTSAGLFG